MVVGDVERLRQDTYPGRAKATQEVNIAFEVSGQLSERPVDDGSVVKAGDVLARLDPRDFENALEASQAERDRAKAMFERVEQAAKTGAVSQQELSDAQAVYEEAVARVGIRDKALDDTVITAPFDGTVATTYVENFQNVVAKQPVLRLLDTSEIEMVVNVPEALIGLVPYVTEVEVAFSPLPDVTIPARIKEVSNEATITTRTYPVTLIMDQLEGGEIKPGMAGNATAIVQPPEDWVDQGVEVPAAAVFSPNDATPHEKFVWVVDAGSGVIARRPIEVVGMNARGVLIKGVEPGEHVVIAGVSYLVEGQQVRIVQG